MGFDARDLGPVQGLDEIEDVAEGRRETLGFAVIHGKTRQLRDPADFVTGQGHGGSFDV
jgi:hypothetical protein